MPTVPTVPTYAELTGLSQTVGEQLLRAGLTCATAESCTGGLVGHLLTEVAGCSAYFMGGAITYSNEVKARILGVDGYTLATDGAVSAPAAAQMAAGARQLYGVDVAVSITGIAGPGGATPTKPVGTVYWHVSAADGYEQGMHVIWHADRSGNKLLSAAVALQLLVDYLAQRAAAPRPEERKPV
jgi:PncC family amidohydrolase